jgi:hypothetical protein
MEPTEFFSHPSCARQRQYEALKAFSQERLSAAEAAACFGFSVSYFKKLRVEFVRRLRQGRNPFFVEPKTGPKQRRRSDALVEQIIALRKHNYAITDIKAVLEAQGCSLSLDTIDQLLKTEGVAPLPKRTRQQRLTGKPPPTLPAPRSGTLTLADEDFTTTTGAGPLVFLPLLERLEAVGKPLIERFRSILNQRISLRARVFSNSLLGIVPAITQAPFPSTSEIRDGQAVLSLLALKLMGTQRWSHDTAWNLDRALGLFAGLNVLPKATTLASYSYRVTRTMNRRFLLQLSRCFQHDSAPGEFNLDFKTIPHWGDASVLEKHGSGSRAKALTRVLALIVQDPATGHLAYPNADIRQRDQSAAVLDFVDFWKQGRGIAPKVLIFDSKLTTYRHLDQLNQSPERITFLTLRRRGKQLLQGVEALPAEAWQRVSVERAKGKHQTLRVHDGTCTLPHYQGEVRQVILTDHGRRQPTFLITNDFELPVKHVVQKYARVRMPQPTARRSRNVSSSSSVSSPSPTIRPVFVGMCGA